MSAAAFPTPRADETEIPLLELGPYLSSDPFRAISGAGVKSGLGRFR